MRDFFHFYSRHFFHVKPRRYRNWLALLAHPCLVSVWIDTHPCNMWTVRCDTCENVKIGDDPSHLEHRAHLNECKSISRRPNELSHVWHFYARNVHRWQERADKNSNPSLLVPKMSHLRYFFFFFCTMGNNLAPRASSKCFQYIFVVVEEKVQLWIVNTQREHVASKCALCRAGSSA